MEKNILRIVRLSFKSENIPDFMDIFHKSQPLIEAFEGCFSVKLKKDASMPNVFYTVSEWQNEEALENYRHSELFISTWAKTKVLFNDRPQAFSLADPSDL
jgi:quinol monooxygenase YgiN